MIKEPINMIKEEEMMRFHFGFWDLQDLIWLKAFISFLVAIVGIEIRLLGICLRCSAVAILFYCFVRALVAVIAIELQHVRGNCD
jgi:hypothetical protein